MHLMMSPVMLRASGLGLGTSGARVVSLKLSVGDADTALRKIVFTPAQIVMQPLFAGAASEGHLERGTHLITTKQAMASHRKASVTDCSKDLRWDLCSIKVKNISPLFALLSKTKSLVKEQNALFVKVSKLGPV